MNLEQSGYNSAYFGRLPSSWTDCSIGPISNRLLATLRSQPYPREGIALDFGCGNGPYLPYLKQSSLSVVGADISPEAVKNSGEMGYDSVVLLDSTTTPLPDRSVAVVFSTEVLEHIEDANAAIKEFHRLLIDGGLLILTTTLYFSSINVYLSTAIQKKHSLTTVIRELLRYVSGFFSKSQQRTFILKWCYAPLGGHFHGFRPGYLKKLIHDTGFRIVESHPLFIFEPIGFSRYSNLKSAKESFRFPVNMAMMVFVSMICAANFCLKKLNIGANNIYLVARKNA